MTARVIKAERWPANALITVLGATGTGKSKLAVTLAKRFGGEIVNADAIQLYEGLPIVTNKIPAEEMQGIRHHLLGTIGLKESPWTVGRYVAKASSVINDIRQRGKLPILVGGTHYYMQGLLFHDQTVKAEDEEFLQESEQAEKWPILKGTKEQIYEKLREVDPDMAAKWHPNDTRRVRRSLVIWLQSGKKASEIYAEQEQRAAIFDLDEEGCQSLPAYNSLLRYNMLAFWTHVDKDVLKERLNDRVDTMLQSGLLDEVRHMRDVYQQLAKGDTALDDSRGIWVAIGFKEFLDYLDACESGSCSERDLKAHLELGIEKTKAATRQYAKGQVRFIRFKLLPVFQKAVSEQDALKVFPLNAANENDWDARVAEPAVQIAESFLAGQPLNRKRVPDPELVPLVDEKVLCGQSRILQNASCDLCGVRFTTVTEEMQHRNSKRHKTALRRKKALAVTAQAIE